MSEPHTPQFEPGSLVVLVFFKLPVRCYTVYQLDLVSNVSETHKYV